VTFRDILSRGPMTEERRKRHIPLVADLGDAAGCKSIQGLRPHMEDTYQSQYNLNGDPNSGFFAVFDGHGGARASAFAARVLHKLVCEKLKSCESAVQALDIAFRQLDAEWLALAAKHNFDDGSTGVAALVLDNVLYCANVGDSRCVLSNRRRAVDMSHDHKPIREDEKQRIVGLGGKVVHYGTWRVEGVLAVSRAFGDRKLKKYVIAEPEIKIRKLDENDDFIILASDGVWDLFSSQEAVEIVARAKSPEEGAIMLTDAAYNQGSMDNITALVVDLKYFQRR
jgi:protein phosphatase 1L